MVVIRRVYRGVYDVRVVSSDGVGDVSDVDRVEVFVVVGSFYKNLKCNVKTLLNVIMVEILIDIYLLFLYIYLKLLYVYLKYINGVRL